MVGVDRDKLRRELVSLRGRQGMLGKTIDCAHLMEVLAISPEELQTRIVLTLRGMGTHQHVLALINAYAFDIPNPTALQRTTDGRRQVFGAAQEPPVFNSSTVQKWENRAIEELIDRLLAQRHEEDPHGGVQVMHSVAAFLAEGRVLHYSETAEVYNSSAVDGTNKFAGGRIDEPLVAAEWDDTGMLFWRMSEEDLSLENARHHLQFSVRWHLPHRPARVWFTWGSTPGELMRRAGKYEAELYEDDETDIAQAYVSMPPEWKSTDDVMLRWSYL